MVTSCSTSLCSLSIPPKEILKDPMVLQQWLNIIQLIFIAYISRKPDQRRMGDYYIRQKNTEDEIFIDKTFTTVIDIKRLRSRLARERELKKT